MRAAQIALANRDYRRFNYTAQTPSTCIYRDDAGDHAATALCAAHVSSSGRQKRIEVRALGWSLEGRRLTTANNEGSVTTWSGSDFSHLNTTQHHLDRATGQGVSIQALAWLRDGTSFVTGDAQVLRWL